MNAGYVAFLDVLGFRLLVTGDNADERLQAYLDTLSKVINPQEDDSGLQYVVSSDSIVLTTSADSNLALMALLKQCSKILWFMLEAGFPLRGAIAHGTYLRKSTKIGTFVAGRPIIEAYHFETIQDWIGIMLAPSVIKKAPNLAELCKTVADSTERGIEVLLRERLSWIACVQPCFIPFHSNNPLDPYFQYKGFAVVPTDGNLEPTAIRNT